MGSLLDQCNCRRKVVQHFISQILKYSNILTKMASFKILLVVALVAFIGSTDALKCMDTVGKSSAPVSAECAKHETSCMITAKITLTGAKPTLGAVTIQACVAKDLGAKKYETPEEIVNNDLVSFYCKADDCNVAEEITKVLKEDVAKTLEAMKAVGHAVTEKGSESKGAEGAGAEGAGAEGAGAEGGDDDKKGTMGPSGAAQTTVAVATIALSTVMA